MEKIFSKLQSKGNKSENFMKWLRDVRKFEIPTRRSDMSPPHKSAHQPTPRGFAVPRAGARGPSRRNPKPTPAIVESRSELTLSLLNYWPDFTGDCGEGATNSRRMADIQSIPSSAYSTATETSWYPGNGSSQYASGSQRSPTIASHTSHGRRSQPSQNTSASQSNNHTAGRQSSHCTTAIQGNNLRASEGNYFAAGREGNCSSTGNQDRHFTRTSNGSNYTSSSHTSQPSQASQYTTASEDNEGTTVRQENHFIRTSHGGLSHTSQPSQASHYTTASECSVYTSARQSSYNTMASEDSRFTRCNQGSHYTTAYSEASYYASASSASGH